MRFFTAVDFQHLVLALFLGLAVALIIYISFRYGKNHKATVEDQPTIFPEYPEETTAGSNPIPPVLLFVYIGVALWILFYVILFFLNARPV